MNKINNKTLKRSVRARRIIATSNCREGITVIEVMTAMLVALIGVFGVLVLIPFAVQQAQLGLDQDAALLVADNAVEDLQIMGLTSVDDAGQLRFRGSRVLRAPGTGINRGIAPLPDGTVVPVSPAEVYGNIALTPVQTAPNYWPMAAANINANNPTIFHFDPIAVSNVGFPVVLANLPTATNIDCFNTVGTNPDFPGGENPDFLTGNLPSPMNPWNDLRIPVVTATNQFLNNNGFAQIMGREEANRLFRSRDDLAFSETDLFPADGVDVSDVDLPQPIFDTGVDGAGNAVAVRRQSSGRVSWSAVFVPIKGSLTKATFAAAPTIATQYKVYILVYSDRSVIPTDPRSQMLAATVHRVGSGTPGPVVGGYQAAVNRIPLLPGVTVNENVQRDTWVMLINKRPSAYHTDIPAWATPVQTAGFGLTYDPNPALPPGARLVGEEQGYQTQVAFARVRSLSLDAASGVQTIFVEGGPFDYYDNTVAGINFGINPTTGAPDDSYSSDTHVVHLQNVINVYERTITLTSAN